MPSSIPPDLYDRVFDLASAITSASEASDDAAYAAGVAELRALFDQHARQGSPHPFLTEALADYTEDAKEAIELYQLALQQCVTFEGEPTHTKHIGLAERLIQLGEVERAREHLTVGRDGARRAGDKEAIDHAALVARSLVA
jgi:hypothetical protein